MKLLSRISRPHRLAIHVVLLLACFAFLSPRADAQFGNPQGLLNPQLGTRVAIPDANLRQVVANSIPAKIQVVIGGVVPTTITIQTNGEITTVTMSVLTSLAGSDASITDLTGLERATGLVALNLSGNNISTLTALSSLTKLKFLDLSRNKIQSPAALATLTQLQLLNLSNNSISSIGHLSKLTNLVRLDLSDNSLTSLTGIEDMTKLTHLYLGNNGITGATVAPLRTLLGKDNVSLQTDILVVKSVVFVNEPATSYGAGDTVKIAVAFFNRGVRHVSMSELARVPTVSNGRYTDDPEPEYYTGDKPYVALAFDGSALSVDGTKSYLHKAEWGLDDANEPRNTTVHFEYTVPQRASVDTLSINSLQVPADTRITHEYKLMSSFPLQLAAPTSSFTDVIGLHQTVDLPSSLPTGKPIRASGPLFPTGTRAENMLESTPASGDVLTLNADDPDTGDTITYTITGGADRNAFKIAGDKLRLVNMLNRESPTDVLSELTDAKGNPTSTNAAGNNQYVVVVQASSGTKPDTDLQRITVTVTNVNEAPGRPTIQSLDTGANAPNELEVSWNEPSNTGPSITDYDVQYRTGTNPYTDWPYTGTGTSTTLTGLTPNTLYDVQVRAKNDEGTGLWSNEASTTTPANSAPSFTTNSALDDVAENETAIATIAATDADFADYADAVTSYTLVSGADAEYFQISSNGALTVINAAGLDFENPVDKLVSDPDGNALGDNEYVIDIEVTSGTNKRALSATRRFVFTVTDVAEPPPAIKEDSLTAAGVPAEPTHLTVSWEAPTTVPDSIPAIEDYYVQYREVGGSWPADEQSDGENVDHTGIETTTLITGLSVGGAAMISGCVPKTTRA